MISHHIKPNQTMSAAFKVKQYKERGTRLKIVVQLSFNHSNWSGQVKFLTPPPRLC